MRIAKNLCVVLKTVLLALFLSNAIPALPTAVQAQTNSQDNALVKPANQTDELSAFLKSPIDLITFKNKKGPSNSGSFKASPWVYRPKEPGFFYQYRLFTTPTRYSESERFGGFSIVVYKFGQEIGDYYDSNETLIFIWCRLNDPDLGQANLVGTFVPEIKARFGEPFAVVEDVLIYYQNGRALSVHTKNGAVDWFKYVRLSRVIDSPEAVPELLLQPGPGW